MDFMMKIEGWALSCFQWLESCILNLIRWCLGLQSLGILATHDLESLWNFIESEARGLNARVKGEFLDFCRTTSCHKEGLPLEILLKGLKEERSGTKRCSAGSLSENGVLSKWMETPEVSRMLVLKTGQNDWFDWKLV